MCIRDSSNGALTELTTDEDGTTTSWQLTEPASSYLITLAIGDYAHASNTTEDGLRVIYDGFLALADCSLPTIAAVNGPAVGAGLNQALDADVHARFDALRAWRRDRASEQHVPPYVIFQDKTLLEIATREPGTLDALAAIPGVGQSKIDRYGPAVLAALGRG